MTRRYTAAVVCAAFGLSLLAAACGGGGGGSAGGGTTGGSSTLSSGAVKRGGVYRIATDQYNFTGNFDPTGEYLGTAFALYSNLLIRTLVGYEHEAGAAGNKLVPDLATDLGQVSDNGLTYTFHLKNGVKFGPPVNREITSKDIKYAFERIGTKNLVAQYGFYYTVIKGMKEFTAAGGLTKPGNDISGIETPNDNTIVFHLTQKTGDFLYRLAMPAAGPIPEEVAKCFTKAGGYGRDVVSSGPYMLAGSDEVDIKSCSTIKPMSGFDPTRDLKFVRNPSYDQSTDSTRQNYIDGLDYSIDTNINDIFDRITKGTLEGEVASPPAQVLKQYSQSSDLKDRLQVNAGDRTWYISMNLTQPPFDDIHVRKAANWVMDKQALQRAWGGPIRGKIAHHIVPDSMFNGALDDYDPYATPNGAGDLAKAKAEMKLSKYDSNHDGVCDASACKSVLFVNRNSPPWTDMEPIIQNDLAKIGIKLVPREFEDAYPVIQDTSKSIPVTAVPGWGKDYADAGTFMVLFDSSSILPQGNVNYSLVGLTPKLASADKITGTTSGLPNVDGRIAACQPLTGSDRLTCWENLDKYLMENVVPWVPYLDATNVDVIGPAVTKYEYDQFSGESAFSRDAVDPAKQTH